MTIHQRQETAEAWVRAQDAYHEARDAVRTAQVNADGALARMRELAIKLAEPLGISIPERIYLIDRETAVETTFNICNRGVADVRLIKLEPQE
jgi:hypothetical protein